MVIVFYCVTLHIQIHTDTHVLYINIHTYTQTYIFIYNFNFIRNYYPTTQKVKQQECFLFVFLLKTGYILFFLLIFRFFLNTGLDEDILLDSGYMNNSYL